MIDTHLHLWQLNTGWYGWNTPDLGAVHADSDLDEVSGAMTEIGVSAAVVVQAADTLAETAWLLALAEHEAQLAGVVGYLPLDDEAALADLLATYAGSEALVGVRQLWHDHEDPVDLARDTTIRALQLLGEAGLAVDVPDAFPTLWPAVTMAVDAAPQTTFVLDHAGKPPFGDAAGWTRWERGFRHLASRPNVVVKLSGLFGGSGSAHPAGEAELAHVVALTREVAGASRTMIGSDWPMTRGRVDYATAMTRLDLLLSSWSAAEREMALQGTAASTYPLASA